MLAGLPRTLLRIALAGAVAYLAIAGGLILSQWPGRDLSGNGLQFPERHGGIEAPEPQGYVARDGAQLAYRQFPGPEGAPLVVLIHGSGGHGLYYAGLAERLSEHATVLLPDLRGHGASRAAAPDVTHIGQLEEDIADLARAHLQPDQKFVLAGHSSGGGLAIRYAGGVETPRPDGAMLLAPFLKYNAPTMRENSGGWAYPMIRRIIGLSMLNAVGIRALNGLTVIEFNVPEALRGEMIGSYSHRLNTSYAPRDEYLKDISALPPFLLVTGDADEAFRADRYEATMAPVNPGGSYHLIPSVTHLGTIDAGITAKLMGGYLDDLR